MKKLYLVSLLLLLASCQFSYKKSVSGAGEIKSVAVEEFAKEISCSDVQLVDVRTPEEFAQGNIQGSVNIDVNSGHFGADADSLLDKQHKVAVYCRSGRRSKAAANVLVQEGYKVIELDKGIISWQQEKFPTVK